MLGLFVFVLVVSALIALGGSFFFLSRYRRAVLRGMAGRAGAAEAVPPTPAAPAAASPPVHALTLERLPAGAPRADLPGPEAAARGYLLAGAGYAGTMALAAFASERFELAPAGVAYLFWIYAWPGVLAANMVAGLDHARVWRNVGLYAAAGLALIAATASGGDHAASLVGSWLIVSGLPSCLVGAFLARRLRAAGPLLLAMALPAVLGSQLALWLLGASDAAMRSAADIGHALGLGAIEVLLVTTAAGTVLFGAIAWAGLRRLGASYERRGFSDEMLSLGAMGLTFALSQAMLLATTHWAWWLAGPAAFVVAAGLARWRFARLARAARPRTLLLLRVFALGPRSARLFDLLRRRWLRGGSIAMIAGPDLATTAVEPHEFLAFLGGRLDRQFVEGEADLERRIGQMRPGTDPDARHRVHEFFCRADTWQAAVQRLLGRSDAVLMDLRGFGPAHAGCAYEIGRVLDEVPLPQVVFAIDRGTDMACLRGILESAWAALSPRSPNRASPTPAARLFEVHGPSAAELESLVAHLLGAGRARAS